MNILCTFLFLTHFCTLFAQVGTNVAQVANLSPSKQRITNKNKCSTVKPDSVICDAEMNTKKQHSKQKKQQIWRKKKYLLAALTKQTREET